MRAISGTSGSSGFGSHNREQMDKRTAEREKRESEQLWGLKRAPALHTWPQKNPTVSVFFLSELSKTWNLVFMSVLYGGPKLPSHKQKSHIIGNNYYEIVMYLLYWFHFLHYLLFISFFKLFLFLIFIVLLLADVDLHMNTPAMTARKQRRKERKENAYVQGNVYTGAKQK